ncbi:MAG TPA: flagellar export chaperone FlgN [Gaiellaceae bacterium]|nr:flagellar export chaperone FlgN [Gaiellaceae bacterium]
MTGVVAHLERQVESARKLLGIVLAQAEAIKRQDVETLLARLADVQQELRTRERLERERDELLRAAAAGLGIPAHEVTVDSIATIVSPDEADAARRLSAELRGLLLEVQRVHTTNRVLIRQELSFLDHLMRVLSGAPEAGYTPNGWRRTPQATTTVDARA